MSFAGNDTQISVCVTIICKPVFIVNVAAVSLAISQNFRLAYTYHQTVTENVLDKGVDFDDYFFIRCLLINILIQCFRGKYNISHLP